MDTESGVASFVYVDADTLNPNLLCCICQAPFTEPVTALTCSHTFCNACILHALSISPQCPVDRSALTNIHLVPASHIIRNLVDELLVECPHQEEGCTYTCQRSLMDSHVKDTCGYVKIQCPKGKCDALLFRREESSHDCQSPPVCDDCGEVINTDHSSLCGSTIVDCDACSSPFRRRDMSAHTAVCTRVVIPCLHMEYGCSWTGPRGELADSHIPSCTYEALKGFFKIHDTRLAALNEENALLRQRINALEGTISALQRESHATKTALGPWHRPMPIGPSYPAVAPGRSGRPLSQDGYPFPRQTSSASDLSPPAPATNEGIDQLFASLEPRSAHGGGSNSAEPLHSPTLATHGHPTPLHLPFAVPTLPPSTSPVAPLDLSGSLENTLAGLRASVVALGASLDSASRHTAIAQAADAARTVEELGALRAVVGGLRMQVHSLMVHRNAQVTGRLGDDGQPLEVVDDGVGWMQFGMAPPMPPHVPPPFAMAPRYFAPPPTGPRATKL